MVTLTMGELERLEVLTQLAARRLPQQRAAERLGLSTPQVRRLVRRFVAADAAGLVPRQRGRASNRRLSPATQERALALVRVLCGLRADARAREAHRGPRPRVLRRDAARLDDHRAWFEERGPRCTLLVYVDDSTSRFMELCFAEVESTFDYFRATRRYLERHGKPMAFYSDKLSVFYVVARDRAQGDRGVSQFGRALRDLSIDCICANSPEAKGRVERANGTLRASRSRPASRTMRIARCGPTRTSRRSSPGKRRVASSGS